MGAGKLAAVIAGKLGGEAIEGAARVTSGAIQGAATIAGASIEAMGSTLGGALQGMLTQPPVTNVNISYGEGSVSGAFSPLKKPDPATGKAPTRSSVNSSMSMEQLLTVAVDYLSSIDTNLKNQYIAAQQATRIRAAEDREKKIETPMGLGTENITKDVTPEKQGSNVKSLAGKLLAAGGLLGALKLMSMDSSELQKLAENTMKFADKFGWLFDLAYGASALLFIRKLFKAAGTRGLASVLQQPLKLLGVSITSPIAVAGGIAAVPFAAYKGLEYSTEQAHRQAQADLSDLEKTWGMKAIVSANGVTIGYEINGKKYKIADLPPEYKNILAVYGPGDKRGGTYDRSKKAIENNQATYDALRNGPEPEQVGGPSPSNSQMGVNQGAYDIVYGNGKYGSPQQLMGKKLTDLTIAEVLQFQAMLLKNGPASPVGAYQFNKKTLEHVAPQVLGKDWRNKKFNKATQDSLAEFYWNKVKDRRDMSSVWATLPNGDYSNTKFKDIKDTIIRKEVGAYVGSKPTPQDDAALAGMDGAGETAADWMTSAVEMFKGIGKTDSTFKPSVTATPPSYEKYKDLYQKNLEMETDMIAGVRQKKDQAASIVPSSGADVLRSINGGSLDVINPNYNLSENNIISQYINFFGYAR